MALAQAKMDELRKIWMEKLMHWLEEELGEEVLQQSSGSVAIPTCLGDEEAYVYFTIRIPRKESEEEGDDPYSKAYAYKLKLEADSIKKAKEAEEKRKKIEKDKKRREAKAMELANKIAESKKIIEEANG